MAKPTNKPSRRKATRWQDSRRNHITVLLLALALLLSACSPTTAPTIEVAVQGDLPTPTLEPTPTPTPLPTATPQPSPTATPQPGLSGRILDQVTSQPIAGAKVSAGAYTTTTDADGRYALTGLPPGQYILSVTYEGYDPALSAILTLGQDQAVTANLELYAAGTTPYPQDPMLTNPLDPNGAPTAEEAERLARLQGLTGEVVRVEETKLLGQFLVNYRIGDDIRAAVAELQHEVWKLTDDAGQSWYIIKVCGSQASRLPAEASIATPEPPLPPPLIAFLSDRDREPGWADIYLMNPDGSGQTRVTTGLRLASSLANSLSGLDEHFFWSAVHRKFFYSYTGKLYSLNADGSGETLVAEKVYQFDLSPDGRHIAFYIDADIAIMNIDGTGKTVLTDQATRDSLGLDPHSLFLGAAWSPDGSKIAFYAQGSLALMNADGTDPIRLTPPFKVMEPFSWTPDGRYIAFWSQPGYDLIDVENGSISKFIEDGLGPTWSPDGSKIAFYKSGPSGIPPGGLPPKPDISKGEWQIWVMNTDGSGLTQLTFEGHNCCPVWVRSLVPTPEPVSTLPAKPTRPATPAAVSPPKRLTFYYFYAKWCNYSQQMTPIIKQLEADYKDRMDFTWLNVDKTSSDYWCYKYGIRSIPAYAISDLQGNAVKVWVGAKPESVLAQGIEAVLATTGGGQAYSRTPPNCPNDHARITYPGMNETVSGVVHFRGSADIPNFEYYKFEFRLSGALEWQYLTKSKKPVSDGDLIEWWTNTIEPGVYDVRMIVVDKTGNYPEPCVVTVNVVR